MAKSKPSRREKGRNRDKNNILHGTNGPLKSKSKRPPQKSIDDLLSEAAVLLHQSQPDLALPVAESALRRIETDLLNTDSGHPPTFAPTLLLLAEIHLELGDAEAARIHFARAVRLDPEGAVISAEPFLWLAQLSESGGEESIGWFEKATGILRGEVAELEGDGRGLLKTSPEQQVLLSEKKQKLSDALCSMAEVYMTDLSFSNSAEVAAETYVTEALMVLPDSPSALQTLASVRISQLRTDDAKSALNRSMEVWSSLPPDDIHVPDFPTRISLARLLMEVEMEVRAMEVLDRLVLDDDQSVEAWYLGGWCQVLIAGKEKQEQGSGSKMESEKGADDVEREAREWLRNSLRLYLVQEYEDEKLREHVVELLRVLDEELGIEDEEEWEDDAEGEGEGGEDLDVSVVDEGEDADMT